MSTAPARATVAKIKRRQTQSLQARPPGYGRSVEFGELVRIDRATGSPWCAHVVSRGQPGREYHEDNERCRPCSNTSNEDVADGNGESEDAHRHCPEHALQQDRWTDDDRRQCMRRSQTLFWAQFPSDRQAVSLSRPTPIAARAWLPNWRLCRPWQPPTINSGALALVGYRITKGADPLDFDFNDIASLHVERRLSPVANSSRGSGRDQIAGT